MRIIVIIVVIIVVAGEAVLAFHDGGIIAQSFGRGGVFSVARVWMVWQAERGMMRSLSDFGESLRLRCDCGVGGWLR